MIPMTSVEDTCPRHFGHGVFVVILIVAIVLVAAVSLAGDPPTNASVRATEQFREIHKELRVHLNHMTALVSKLPRQTTDEQKAGMNEVVSLLSDYIHTHANAEEEALYPVVDKMAGSTDPYLFTATMRYEHRIIGRWINELRNHANQATPDVTAFARRADNVIGLVSAHFEEEEDILLPVLDATMTVAQFKKEVLDKMNE